MYKWNSKNNENDSLFKLKEKMTKIENGYTNFIDWNFILFLGNLIFKSKK